MSICKDCFHSYVCEQFNEHRECDNKKCHFANDHFVPANLINRLQAELDEYKKIKTTINEFWEILLTLSLFKRKEKPTLEEFAEAIQEIKAEAYKEFAEMLEKRFALYYGMKIDFIHASKMLDNLLKELVGEENG